MMRYLLCFLILFNVINHTSAQVIITIAGNNTAGYYGDGGVPSECLLHWPEAVAIGDSEDYYIADAENNVIRKVFGYGKVVTVAGNGFEAGNSLGGYTGDNGPAIAAEMYYPSGVAADTLGNIYIADQNNNRIRKVDTAGIITTIAGNGTLGFMGDGGAAVSAELSHPTRVALDHSGNIYVADSGNNRIRMINTSGTINTIAGDGTAGYAGDGAAATAAELYDPIDMAVDVSGNVYIADYVNNVIRKVTAATGNISTIAGTGPFGFFGDGGPATAAYLYEPSGVVVDAAGNVYFSDLGNERVRKIDTAGIITTITGNGWGAYGGDNGLAKQGIVWFPEGLALDKRGQLYIADKGNNRIRLITGVLGVSNTPRNTAAMDVFPNPSGGNFTVKITSSLSEEVVVTVTDVTGRAIYRGSARTNTALQVDMDEPAGLYFISAFTSEGVVNGKIVIQ